LNASVGEKDLKEFLMLFSFFSNTFVFPGVYVAWFYGWRGKRSVIERKKH